MCFVPSARLQKSSPSVWHQRRGAAVESLEFFGILWTHLFVYLVMSTQWLFLFTQTLIMHIHINTMKWCLKWTLCVVMFCNCLLFMFVEKLTSALYTSVLQHVSKSDLWCKMVIDRKVYKDCVFIHVFTFFYMCYKMWWNEYQEKMIRKIA